MLTRRAFAQAAVGACVSGVLRADAPAALETRPIPATGERLPVIGLGTYIGFDLTADDPRWGEARRVLGTLVARGGRVVDTSPDYGAAEAATGRLARELGIVEQLFVASKIAAIGREAGIAQLERMRREFGVDRLDLMQVHNLVDVETHLATLAEWKAEGRLRYVGVTHYLESAYGDLARTIERHRIDFVQVNYSVAERAAAARILPLARERGMGVIVNRPFAAGELFAKLRSRALPAWAADIGCTSWAQVLLKYVLANPAVTCAIPGTRDVGHLIDDLGAGTGALPDAPLCRRIEAEIAAV
ncbi:MAG TPA: aldo/keto reductase [Rudaea sp.]|nr:aldo/keto reductase [Rudaea sp.]